MDRLRKFFGVLCGAAVAWLVCTLCLALLPAPQWRIDSKTGGQRTIRLVAESADHATQRYSLPDRPCDRTIVLRRLTGRILHLGKLAGAGVFYSYEDSMHGMYPAYSADADYGTAKAPTSEKQTLLSDGFVGDQVSVAAVTAEKWVCD